MKDCLHIHRRYSLCPHKLETGGEDTTVGGLVNYS